MTDPEPEAPLTQEDTDIVRNFADPQTHIYGVQLMLKRVVGRGTTMRRIDLRLRRIRLFDVVDGLPADDPARYDMWSGAHVQQGGASPRRMDDHPMLQVILENRDQYLKMKEMTGLAQAAICKAVQHLPQDDEKRTEAIKDLAIATGNLVRSANLALQHLKETANGVTKAMESIAEQTGHEVRLVTHAASLGQNERIANGKPRKEAPLVAGMTSAQLAEKRRLALEKEGP